MQYVNSKNFKIFLPFLIIGLLFTFVLPAKTEALTAQELEAKINSTRKEREVLVAEQKRLQAELNAVSQEGQSLASAVKSLDASKNKLATDIKLTQSKISSTDLNIQSLEDSLDVKGRQIITHRRAIANVLQQLNRYDSRSLILDVVASANMSDVWGDRARLEGLNEELGDTINLLRKTQEDLSYQVELKSDSLEELQGLHQELDGQKKVVENNQSAKAKLLAETKSKEAAYQAMLAENLARQQQFENDLYQFESQLKIILDPSLIPTAKQGVFSWPLDYVYITQKFGKTVGAERLYASGSHNGIDFRASQGTSVKTVMSGVVEGVGNTDEQAGCYSYGRWILIKHPNGLSTIYAHLSAAVVSKGQSVTTGQVIGYSGGTPRTDGAGYSTGPHLHLGLFASQGVEVRQFTQSKGCKQVFVPIADSQAYLDPLSYLPQ